MSFAEEVKNELARYKNTNECCDYAELLALLSMGGSLLLGSSQAVGFSFSTANNAVARRVLSMWKQNFSINPIVLVRRGQKLRKKNIYTLRITPTQEGKSALESLGLIPLTESYGTKQLKRVCCKKAFLRGAFLGGGSVNQPQRDYHLELVTGNFPFSQRLLKVMRYFKLPAKMTERKGDYVLYIKEGNGVTSFLQHIGAVQPLLQFENVRVMKDMRNNVNRVVNCETANLQKTVDASIRQLQHITIIQRHQSLQALPQRLQEVAELRLNNPEATLAELTELMDGKISKSGINHRFNKLQNLAEQLEPDAANIYDR